MPNVYRRIFEAVLRKKKTTWSTFTQNTTKTVIDGFFQRRTVGIRVELCRIIFIENIVTKDMTRL